MLALKLNYLIMVLCQNTVMVAALKKIAGADIGKNLKLVLIMPS